MQDMDMDMHENGKRSQDYQWEKSHHHELVEEEEEEGQRRSSTSSQDLNISNLVHPPLGAPN